MPDSHSPLPPSAANEAAAKRVAECLRRRSPTLDLSHLGITQLPERIHQLTKLTAIDLSHNGFTTFPAFLLDLPDLTRLNLAGNPLTTVPPEISRLQSLAQLDLSATPITHLPDTVGELRRLTKLDVSHTRLESIPATIGRLVNLTRLIADHAAIDTLPPETGSLTNLTRLFLAYNRIRHLPPETGHLSQLTRLDLSHNLLDTLPPEIANLTKLSVLDLSNNRLRQLPEQLGSLSRLTVLRLANNQLDQLPASLCAIDSLETLSLHGNPELQLAPSILGPDPSQQDPAEKESPPPPTAKAILEFHFARLNGSTRPVNEARLHVVGPAGSGKSTLVHALRDQPWRDREPATDGIALSRMSVTPEASEPVTLQIWDFSGNPAASTLHPAFFRPRGLFLLVLAGSNGQEQAEAIHWLDKIGTFGAARCDEPLQVVVVLNQWQTPGKRPTIDRQALRTRFPFIRAFVETDCKARKGIPALKIALSREIERMPWIREPLPGAWRHARDAIITGPPHLDDPTFRGTLTESGVVDTRQQDYLGELLDRLGTVVGASSDTLWKDWGWWRPEAFLKPLYMAWTRMLKDGGILAQDNLTRWLAAEPSVTAAWDGVIGWLTRKKLALPLPPHSGGGWLAPLGLPPQAPESCLCDPNERSTLHLRFFPRQHPGSILHMIGARRFDPVAVERGARCWWQNGLVLNRGETRARFTVHTDENTLYLTVSGPREERRKLLNQCIDDVSDFTPSNEEPTRAAEIRLRGNWETLRNTPSREQRSLDQTT